MKHYHEETQGLLLQADCISLKRLTIDSLVISES